MSKKKFSQKIIDKIKAEDIKPTSPWKNRIKNGGFWAILGAMALLGAVFFSMIILSISGLDRDLWHYLRFSRWFQVFIAAIPLIWLGLSVAAVGFGILALRKTRHGYRYSLLAIAAAALLLIGLLGAAVHFLKFNNHLNQDLAQRAPKLQKWLDARQRPWQQMGAGLVGGQIVELEENSLILESFEGQQWRVNFSEQTPVRGRGGVEMSLERGALVGVVGEKQGEVFEAQLIKVLPDDFMPGGMPGSGHQPGKRINQPGEGRKRMPLEDGRPRIKGDRDMRDFQ